MKKKELPLIIGMILIFIGVFLPAIKIANENISFLKENGCLMVIIVAIMFILYKLNKKQLIIIPSIVSVFSVVKFIIDNKSRLHQINELYNCYANYKYGLFIIILGNILIIINILITSINYQKILEYIKQIYITIKPKEKLIQTTNKIQIKEKIKNIKTKKELTKNIIKQEKTNNGTIKYNKMVVKLNNKLQKTSIKEKIQAFITSLKLNKINHRKLSVTKFKNEYKENISTNKKLVTYQVPVIDITKWTRDDVCCVNCGATISSNSEYCFLCDCKIKLNEKKEKIS